VTNIDRIITWLEDHDELNLPQRRFVDNEIHRMLFGIYHCEPHTCAGAWPASCGDFAKRNDDLPYEPCGKGLLGLWLDDQFLDRAPEYTASFTCAQIAAMLGRLQKRISRKAMREPLLEEMREPLRDFLAARGVHPAAAELFIKSLEES